MRYNSNQKGFRFCIPGYRYCGPGCSGPGTPINPVDSCCYTHDLCYQTNRDKRYCDEQFQRCLASQINRITKEGKDAAFFARIIRIKGLFY